MLAMTKAFSLLGIDGFPVQVEVDISRGLPSFHVVGLPDPAVKEAGDRVKAALRNSGFEYPVRKITVNLSPADMKKEGPHFDLPIALGILAASEQLNIDSLEGLCFIAELSLNGQLRPVKGILSMALLAQDLGFTGMVLPMENAREASLAGRLEVYPAFNLEHVVGMLQKKELKPYRPGEKKEGLRRPAGDFCHVKGQEGAKRALEIAAAGGHNLLMVGPPGAGKTLLARCLPSILPKMSREEKLEVTKIYSTAGLLPDKESLLEERPFRSPHHSISHAALVGGGRFPKPGEVTLAHNGVLFMDEIPEFHKDVLEVLRQPLEEGFVTISRSQGTVRFPTAFTLVAAMNPCNCGNFGQGECTCSDGLLYRYQSRLSGPLLDRIDMYMQVAPLPYDTLTRGGEAESSREIRGRVEKARDIQNMRFAQQGINCNAYMLPVHIKEYCSLQEDATKLLEATFIRLNLSARSYFKVLKLARTIADLDGDETINLNHLAEAVQYRAENKIKPH